MFLKYAYMLAILIHQFVHVEFSDGTLPIHLKFIKKHLIAENLNEVKSSSLTILFFKSSENLAKCHQKMSLGQTDELKWLVYRHILKTFLKVL